MIESTLLAVYGTALHDEEVVSISVDAFQSRLDRLKKSLTTKIPFFLYNWFSYMFVFIRFFQLKFFQMKILQL